MASEAEGRSRRTKHGQDTTIDSQHQQLPKSKGPNQTTKSHHQLRPKAPATETAAAERDSASAMPTSRGIAVQSQPSERPAARLVERQRHKKKGRIASRPSPGQQRLEAAVVAP
eukprot:2814757-Alexandrium_andersonii.AAC.1